MVSTGIATNLKLETCLLCIVMHINLIDLLCMNFVYIMEIISYE